MSGSGYLPERVEVFIENIDSAKTLDETFEAFVSSLHRIGFDKFTYWLLTLPQGEISRFHITNYPDEWVEHYTGEDHGSHDFIAKHSVSCTIPFIWNDVRKQNKLTERQLLIFEEGKGAGLVEGGTVPIHGPGHAKATLSVANEMKAEEFKKFFLQHRHEIHLMATYVHEKVLSLGLHKPVDSSIHLTPREIEILTWVAKGKSRWETSVILSISEDTVKSHLNNVRSKLNASNTTHAIAIALMHGLLLP